MKVKSTGWKKVHADEHFTTLEDSRGHQMRVAHKALSKKMRKDLEALECPEPAKMADGGQVPDNSKKTVGEIIGYPGAGKGSDTQKPKPQAFYSGGKAAAEQDQSVSDPVLR
jgi:hypothetical protein